MSIRERLMSMGGHFKVESAPGEGSRFSLIVPLEISKTFDGRATVENISPRTSKAAGDTIRVLLADDHTVVREGISAMLDLHSDIQVIGEAPDGEVAVHMARKLKPDVILMDLNMPKMNGLEATRIIRSESPDIRIVGLSMSDDENKIAEMKAAGASAYCAKDGDTDDLLTAIRG